MEIDWSSIQIEFLNSGNPSSTNIPFDRDEMEYYESQNSSRETTISALEFDIDEVLERNEFDPAAFEKLIDFNGTDALLSDDTEGVVFDTDSLIEEVYDESYEVTRNPMRKAKQVSMTEVAAVPYFCETCTLDFPSEAYLTRHLNTKKHQRALNMEKRGRKVNQKRKYVRKNSCKLQTVEMVENFSELTNDELELLDVINQEIKTEDMKNFYENFDLELKVD